MKRNCQAHFSSWTFHLTKMLRQHELHISQLLWNERTGDFHRPLGSYLFALIWFVFAAQTRFCFPSPPDKRYKSPSAFCLLELCFTAKTIQTATALHLLTNHPGREEMLHKSQLDSTRRKVNSQPPAPSLTSKQYINTADICFLCFSPLLHWFESLVGYLTKNSVSPPVFDFYVGCYCKLCNSELSDEWTQEANCMNTADSCWGFNGLYAVEFTLERKRGQLKSVINP